MVGNKPVKKIAAGAVRAALWENEIEVDGAPKTVLKVSLDRRYKDKNGEWKSSQSFSRNEIPLAIWCLERAFDAIIGEQGNGGDGQADVPVEDVRD